MTQEERTTTGKSFVGLHIPYWDELPSIDLYMDQIINYINGSLGPFFAQVGIAPITKSMINNYVKARIVDAPVNKKYPRLSLAMIIVVYILKNCYATDEVGKLIQLGLCLDELSTTYDRFCVSLEQAVENVFSGKIHVEDEKIKGRESKYLMDNFALSFACKIYVQKIFLQK